MLFKRTSLFVVVVSLLPAANAGVGSAAPSDAAGRLDAFGRLPLAFEENRGQADASAKFIARAPGYTVLLGDADAVLRLPGGSGAFRMSLAGGARAPRVSTSDRQAAVSHYLIGNDPAKWQSHVPRYGSVRYAQVYDGIDLVYYGNQRQLEHDFVVAPGADPARIVLQFSGVDTAAIESSGDLVLRVNDEAIRFHKPVAYQGAGAARRQVAARFDLEAPSPIRGFGGASGGHRVRFTLGDYDATRELVIDPVLSYSSYGGGAGSDYAFGIAVDGSGNTYVTGATDSLDFPTTAGAFSRTFAGTTGVPPGGDAFVLKLDPAGALVYSTYIGGSKQDRANAIAVDASGNAYITGATSSTNYPTTAGSVQPKIGNDPFSSNGDMFVTKLNASGSGLVYSTYLGGESLTHGYGIAVDSTGSAYVTGETWYYFRTTNPLVDQNTSAFSDAFIAKLTPSGSGLSYATLFGGNDLDEGYGVAIDGSGNAHVIGRTSSSNLPMLSAAQPVYGGFQDAFVARFNASGARVYSTYLGGDDLESAGGIAVDGAGNAYVSGGTSSSNFPVTAGALQTTKKAFSDAFVTKLSPSGAFSYSTFLGGALPDNGSAIAVDASGSAFVTGTTQSSDFPSKTPVQAALGDSFGDVFLTQLNPAGSATVLSTFLGGSAREEGYAIALDASLNVYLAGRTQSTSFPTQSPFQATNRGGTDFIVAKIRTVLPTMTLDRSALTFAAVASGSAVLSTTGSQPVRLTQSGSGAVTWTATSSAPWLGVSPASGSGSAALNVFLNTGAAFPPPGNAPATIALTFSGAATASTGIAVTLSVVTSGASTAPTGSFDTPLEGAAGISGSIPVTGWAIDDVEVVRVRLFRDPAGAEPAGQVFLGDAVLVDGARPDVAAQNPNAPRNTRAGWGYLLLTNFLPNLGNGTFRLYAYAEDADGHTTLLGSKTITCSNSTATTPFGAIDTPLQGETVSGTINDFGWVLSPGARRADPPSGGAVQVLIDGAVVGTPSGWVSRSDLSSLFPSAQFSGVGNALGVYTFDTTTLSNGVHTIAWVVTDNQGGAAGVGSRYFTVSNGSGQTLGVAQGFSPVFDGRPEGLRYTGDVAQGFSPAPVSITGRRGFDLDAPFHTYAADPTGRITIQAEELDRIELHAGKGSAGYSRVNGELKPLTIGARLDASSGAFTWNPGVGFLGAHDFVLGGRDVRIVLNPKGSGRVGPQTVIDIADGAVIAGWAADLDAASGTGVDTLHVWAYPAGGGNPIFAGVADYGGARPDVAAIYGARFLHSGYGLRLQGVPPGTYDLAVFAFSTVRGTFAPATVVRVTVK